MQKILDIIKQEKLSTSDVSKIINSLPRDTVKAVLRVFVVNYPEDIFGEENVEKNVFGQLTIHNIHSYKTVDSSMAMNSVNLPIGH